MKLFYKYKLHSNWVFNSSLIRNFINDKDLFSENKSNKSYALF